MWNWGFMYFIRKSTERMGPSDLISDLDTTTDDFDLTNKKGGNENGFQFGKYVHGLESVVLTLKGTDPINSY